MLSAVVTNLSSTDSIGNGVDSFGLPLLRLPPPIDWFTLAPSGAKTVTVMVRDMNKIIDQTTGFTTADALQQLVQAGKISFALSNIATDRDVGSKAVALEVS